MVEASRKQTELSARGFERILLVKPSSLGDIIHALPLLHGLRERYPDARIDWLVSTAFVPLLENHPDLTGVIPFDRRRYGRLGRSLSATRDFMRFVWGLRANRYDLVVDIQGLFRTGFLSWMTRASTRIGFSSAREYGWVFYNYRIDTPDPNQHAVDRNCRVAELLGFADVPVRFDLALRDEQHVRAASILQDAGVGEGDRLVMVVPGARWDTKMWLPERVAETIDALQREDGVRCVLLGAPDEVDLIKRITVACRTEPVDLAGRTTVAELAPLIARANVVLCQDSAAVHLACALDRPLVCITGPTNALRTGPYRRLNDVVRMDLDCSPCYLRRLSQCPHHHRCMSELDASTVLDAVRRALRVSCAESML